MSSSAQWTWSMPDSWDEAAVRQVAAALFNGVWDLMEAPHRSPDDDERMVAAAHASRFHWGMVGTPRQWSHGEWLLSRAYSVVGRAEPALHHARLAEQLTVEHQLGPFELGFAYEALARARGLAGALAERDAWLERGRACARQVADARDRAWLEENLAELAAAQ